ncbi:MAG TPA: methyltransferase domain-containing protein, partial [Nitriliruptorales bacterium]
QALVDELHRAGVDAHPGTLAPEAVRAPGADPRRLAAVNEGRARPQDEASMVVAHETQAASGERVLEVGAGPGGKATHLAAMVGRTGEVVAVELHPHRSRLVREAAAQLGVTLDVRTGDATDPSTLAPLGDFDAVLVDAPCSDLGVGRRRPEIRWRRRPEDVVALSDLQRRLLHPAADRVKPGGRLVYAVCTWTRAETVGQVRRLLAERDDLELELERQLLPDLDGTDGMYLARFRRAVA